MGSKQRIMIVDDERINRKVLSNLLEDKHDVVLAKDGRQVLDRFEKDPEVDLILLDVMMPQMNGYDVLKKLKEIDYAKDIPVIFITSLNSVDDEEMGLKLGAADYITKPFNPSIVKLRVENHLKFVHQRKLLETLAGRDGLTEINNRRSFDTVFEKEWKRMLRNKSPLSLIMIDVDCFKKFNDFYGHASGDEVLKSIACTLSKRLARSSDVVARYGGEEFVIILPHMKREDAISFAEKIRLSVESLFIPHEKSEANAYVTISLGGATFNTSDQSTHDLLKAADKMLYRAKEIGRNTVVWRD